MAEACFMPGNLANVEESCISETESRYKLRSILVALAMFTAFPLTPSPVRGVERQAVGSSPAGGLSGGRQILQRGVSSWDVVMFMSRAPT